MKKFLMKLGLLFVALVIVDRALGMVFAYMSEQAIGGYIGHHNYIVKKSKDDILIFGSSRAVHHYNAAMIQDSLRLSCYNCGQDGEGIVLYYGWWQIIKQRYLPSVVLYEVTPIYDISAEDNSRHLGWLKGLYDNNEVIREEFNAIDKKESFKMMSLLYRYNSRFHQILMDYFHPVHNMTHGFLPVHQELDPLRVRIGNNPQIDVVSQKERGADTLKLSYFDKFMQDMDSTKLVLVVSPTWYGKEEQSLGLIKKLAEKYNCPFLDYTQDLDFVNHDELFYDGTHMNAKGADKFTLKLIQDIRRMNII